MSRRKVSITVDNIVEEEGNISDSEAVTTVGIIKNISAKTQSVNVDDIIERPGVIAGANVTLISTAASTQNNTNSITELSVDRVTINEQRVRRNGNEYRGPVTLNAQAQPNAPVVNGINFGEHFGNTVPFQQNAPANNVQNEGQDVDVEELNQQERDAEENTNNIPPTNRNPPPPNNPPPANALPVNRPAANVPAQAQQAVRLDQQNSTAMQAAIDARIVNKRLHGQ